MAFGNIRKAYDYLKKNGIEDTFYASVERITGRQEYDYQPVSRDILNRQRERIWDKPVKFSIVVPAYETKEEYIKACIESVLAQTYGCFELIIADASLLGTVRKIANSYKDHRIKYLQLSENKGISANTNAGLRVATGDYIGLLDHDDILTPDCLYEYADLISKGSGEDTEYAFIYSDEDKCDEKAVRFYEPNFKPGFNIDLLLTNNYICHFLVMKAGLMKELKFRSFFDGAQDHDILLRAYAVTAGASDARPVAYGHIPKVLYHWRCHNASTAANPASKSYAYEAGKRAVSDYLKNEGMAADVKHTAHNGFFRIEYKDNLIYPKKGELIERKKRLTVKARGRLAYNTFLNRYDIGSIGGPVIKDGKIVSGIMDSTKTCIYDGMNIHFSGYMHRAVLQQDALYLDIRNLMVLDELAGLIVKIAGNDRHIFLFDGDKIDVLKDMLNRKTLKSPYVDVADYLSAEEYEDYDYMMAGVSLCSEISLEGYLNLYDPLFLPD